MGAIGYLGTLGRPSVRLEFATNDEMADYFRRNPDLPRVVKPTGASPSLTRKVERLARQQKHEPAPEPTSEPAALPTLDSGVVLVPLKDILTDREAFQNRADHFSQETVDRILADYASGNFRWANLDAITLWLGPEGKYYIISGHSRFEAFSQLAAQDAKAEGKTFDAIPAKIFEGTKEEAIEMARNSNTLSTKERDSERATYYRNRLAAGATRVEVAEEAKQREGKNANYILNLAVLSSRGNAWLALVAMEDATDVTNAQKVRSLADWIGQARRRFPELQNGHEGELFKWLTEQYGKPGFTKRTDFIERVERAILAAKQAGTFDRALNPYGNAYKKPGEIQYDEQLREATQAWQEAKAELEAKRKKYADDGLTLERLNEILAPYEHTEKLLLLRLEKERARAAGVKADASRELSLFSGRAIADRLA